MSKHITNTRNFVRVFNLFVFSIVIFFTGCQKEDVLSIQPETSNAKIEGKVLGDGGFSKINKSFVDGAKVYLSLVDENGFIQKIPESDCVTNKEGIFNSTINISGNKIILISAAKGDRTWETIINLNFQNGLTYYAQPLNDETTSEAAVFIEKLKNNFSNVSYSDVSIFIDETITKYISSKNVNPFQIASAINDIKNIEVSTLSNIKFIPFSVNVDKINTSKSFAQSLLERDLYYSKTQNDFDASFAAFYESIVAGYTNSGIEPDNFYKLLEIAHRSLLSSISNIDANVKIEIEKKASQVRAYVLNYAVQTKISKMRADAETYATVINAGGKLYASLKDAKSHDEIIKYFSDYHAEIIQAIYRLMGVRSDAIKILDKGIEDLKPKLISSINFNTTGDVLISEYLNFFSGAAELVAKAINKEGDSQLQLSADIILLLNMQF